MSHESNWDKEIFQRRSDSKCQTLLWGGDKHSTQNSLLVSSDGKQGDFPETLGSLWKHPTCWGSFRCRSGGPLLRSHRDRLAGSLRKGGIRRRFKKITRKHPRFKPILPICSNCLGASVNDYFSQQISHRASFFILPVCCLDGRSGAAVSRSCQPPRRPETFHEAS